MEKLNNWKIGDTVWMKESWSGNYYECVITKIGQTDHRHPDKSVAYADLKVKNDLMTLSASFDKLYLTREELVQKDNAQKIAYLDEIKSKGDLIRFMFDHCINGEEHTDDEARAAVIEKMAEFGINCGRTF